jgi:PTS system galactitol-specific IIB component
MDPVKILCVCGTGVAGANIVMLKLQEAFANKGIPIQLTTIGTSQVSGIVADMKVDLIVSTSTLQENKNIPFFQAIPFYTGIGEKELLDDIIRAAQTVLKQRESTG